MSTSNTMNKPFSQACENNKQAILSILDKTFKHSKHVLEIGSGTGQHAVYFGKNLSQLTWQTSDLPINHQGINLWINEASLNNVLKPINVDLNLNEQIELPSNIDALYTANTLHIVSWPLVINFFSMIKNHLAPHATVCIYGPFKYQGNFTSESNANFDLWLKDRDLKSGVRNIEDILTLATQANLTLLNDHEMPANNRLLAFKKCEI